MAPDIISFVQDTFHEGFFEKANLPTVVRIHDNSCCLPFSDVLEDLFNPLGVGLMANYCSVVNTACNHNDLRIRLSTTKIGSMATQKKYTDVNLHLNAHSLLVAVSPGLCVEFFHQKASEASVTSPAGNQRRDRSQDCRSNREALCCPSYSFLSGQRVLHQGKRGHGPNEIHFYGAWRNEPILNGENSSLLLPSAPGMLQEGCHWRPRSRHFS